jgi:hypothetical protein
MDAERVLDAGRPGRPAWLTPSVAVLVGANLFPLYGVLFEGWKVFPIVLLFWLENVIVGVFFILRLLLARPQEPVEWIAKLFMVPFFTFHYGMFTMVHGVFVFALFGREMGKAGDFPTPELVLKAVHTYHLGPAFLALAASHAFSYVWNYLAKGECRTVVMNGLMAEPYKRVIVLHVSIIGSGFLLMALHAPLAGLILLLALKTALDIVAHTREHRKAAARGQADADFETAH